MAKQKIKYYYYYYVSTKFSSEVFVDLLPMQTGQPILHLYTTISFVMIELLVLSVLSVRNLQVYVGSNSLFFKQLVFKVFSMVLSVPDRVNKHEDVFVKEIPKLFYKLTRSTHSVNPLFPGNVLHPDFRSLIL